jgi:ribosomal protein S18 acetylase RimI-like enzyme
MAKSGVTIERVARDRLREELLARVYAVYCAALELDPAAAPPRAWRDDYLPRHATRDDFTFLTATDDGDVLGFAYGYTGSYGQWWTDRVAAAMDEETRAVWLDAPHFEVCELQIRPDQQRRGLGRRLLEDLLARQPHDRALLTANPAKAQPLPFYRKHGWIELAGVRFGEADVPYVVLGKELR